MGVSSLFIIYQKKQHLVALLPVYTLCSVFIYDITHLALTQYLKFRGAVHSDWWFKIWLVLYKIYIQMIFVNSKTENLSFRKQRSIYNWFLRPD